MDGAIFESVVLYFKKAAIFFGFSNYKDMTCIGGSIQSVSASQLKNIAAF